jgi:hypothetical protein
MGYSHIILCFNVGDMSKFQRSFLQHTYTVAKLLVLFLVIFNPNNIHGQSPTNCCTPEDQHQVLFSVSEKR